MRRFLASAALLLGFLSWSVLPVAAQAAACGDYSSLSATQKVVVLNTIAGMSGATTIDEATASSTFSSTFSCQNVAGVDATARSQRCVTGLCSGGTDNLCCAAGTGGRGSAAGTDAGTSAPARSGFLRIELPACVSTGDCELDDIVKTGVNFANFLFGISGAVLLATFVYGGVLYLIAGKSGDVAKAKKMIVDALIGMLLVFGAGLLVTTIYNTFKT